MECAKIDYFSRLLKTKGFCECVLWADIEVGNTGLLQFGNNTGSKPVYSSKTGSNHFVQFCNRNGAVSFLQPVLLLPQKGMRISAQISLAIREYGFLQQLQRIILLEACLLS